MTFAEAEEPVVEHSLIQEIEASEDFIEEQSDPEADTRANYQEGKWKLVVLLSGIFLFATGLGFLGVWLALREANHARDADPDPLPTQAASAARFTCSSTVRSAPTCCALNSPFGPWGLTSVNGDSYSNSGSITPCSVR